METLISASSSIFTLKPSNPLFPAKPIFVLTNPLFVDSRRKKSTSVTVCASKDNNKKKKRKNDTHSFIPKEDEATGPFPEAVLLKQKIIEKDGELFPEFVDDDEERVYQILKLQLENDYQVEILRHYEVVYLIHEKFAEEVESVNEKVKAFLGEKRGKIWRMNDWGMRRLAYKIQKARNAHYILMNIEIDAKWINDFKTMLDKDERVIRHLVMKRDEAITKDCPPPPEFRSFRTRIEDDGLDDEDVDYDDDDDDDDGGDEEDLDGQDEIGEDYGDEDGDGIVFVDEDEDKTRTSKSRAKKVAR